MKRANTRASLADLMTEDAFQSRVLAYAGLLAARNDRRGWPPLLIWHDNDSRRNEAGFLDLVIAGPGGLAFAELKRERGGRVSPEQRRWLDVLGAIAAGMEDRLSVHGEGWPVGLEVHLWRPSDWPAVVATLDRLAARP